MAENAMFIERLDGNIVNISLIQTIMIDPNNDTDVLWYMRKGEIIREDLASTEEATNRYNDLKGLLLGTTIAELEQRITVQQNTIVEQTKTINTQQETIDTQQETIQQTNNDISNLADLSMDINGEEVEYGRLYSTRFTR